MLIGLQEADDAGVLRLSEELALVQSVDYFSPIVDDPYAFGAIAAANALSDLYAMGARPLSALNVAGFPPTGVPDEVLAAIMQGAIDKVEQAGAHVLGGHTVEDRELKFGLAVTGLVHPGRILGRSGARPGDQLILTKPVGGGVVSTAIKRGKASRQDVEELIQVMTALNALTDEMHGCEVHACTDVTGFGLLGHALGMARSSRVAIRLYASRVPLLKSARRLAEEGHIPGGTRHNQQWAEPEATFDPSVSPVERTLLSDAMTSGGLLIAVPAERTAELLERLARRRPPAVALVGEVASGPPGKVQVLP